MNSAERRLQKIARITSDMPEPALRGVFAEILLSDGKKLTDTCSHMEAVIKHFSEKWEHFRHYAAAGYFDDEQ